MADPRFHKNSGRKTLKELAQVAGAELLSGDDVEVKDVAPLSNAEAEDISFLDNVKYKDDFKTTKASACIIAKKMKEFAPKGCHLLISDNPYKSYALIAQVFYPDNHLKDGSIHNSAVIAPSAKIGESCTIEPGVVIGENVEIGAGTRVGANATISHAIIGEDCNIYPGARIGQDGFGFAIDPAGHVKVPQLGRVIIGDHVEIGANSTIDRGAGPDTEIGDGTWIDNLVQIGHNVKIGKGCVIVAQAGVAGSSVLEDYAVIAAQGGVAGHLKVGMGAQVGAQAGIMQDVPAGEKVIGSPAMPIKQFMRQTAMLKKMSSKN